MATADLKNIYGGSSSSGSLYLAPGNVVIPGLSTDGAQWGNFVSVTNVNITGTIITQMASIDVAAGQTISIQSVSIGGLTATSGTVEFEMEVDGEIVITGTKDASTDTSLFFLGRGTVSSTVFNEILPKDIEVRTNVTIRAKKPSATAASLSVSFIKVKV